MSIREKLIKIIKKTMQGLRSFVGYDPSQCVEVDTSDVESAAFEAGMTKEEMSVLKKAQQGLNKLEFYSPENSGGFLGGKVKTPVATTKAEKRDAHGRLGREMEDD